MKKISEMSVAEYQRLAQRLERRFGPDKAWEELPLVRRPGRPAKDERREALTVHSVKMTATEWKALQAEAGRLGITVNALLRSLAQPKALPRVVKAAGLIRA